VDDGPRNATAVQALLGYLNFSTGRPDPRVQAQLFQVWQQLLDERACDPWQDLHALLDRQLTALHAEGHSAFRDVQQARAVLDLALLQLRTAYRRHHADLLHHQQDADLFQAGFAVRALETVLAQQGPWDEHARIVKGALQQLNDYVGHRPVAVLESRPRGEPYDHEKLRPVPLYLRGAGVVPGRYADLVARTLDLLRATPPALHTEAHFDFDRLDELAFDPRAYDHNHPADRRPNYRFGEWDPHLIDQHGFYRRLVVRQLVLDGLLERIDRKERPREELLLEAANVLAATLLMASGITGAGPDTHDSSVTLATLMPRIARYRDAFYQHHLAALAGAHGERLRQEAIASRQPFAGVRQHLNLHLAHQRAAQLQQRHLALLLAELGYPEAARGHAERVPAVSLRMLAEIHIALTTCQMLTDHGKHGEAVEQLTHAEEVLHRAIACGAMVDPWNILGFQGLYPLFQASEDSIHDHRIDELVVVIERLLTLYAHLRSEASAGGDAALGTRLAEQMQRLARWWDRFATTTVADIHHVLGGAAQKAADHVAEALGQWRERGEATADLAFWRQHLGKFKTGESFALVVDALLRKDDYRAAMALLVNWLGQADQVPLEEGEHSFHVLALRWMLGLGRLASRGGMERGQVRDLVRKFIDYLEANAEEYWQVPRLESPELLHEPTPVGDEDEGVYGAAYEGVVYKDSTDDGVEGEILGFETRQQPFELEQESDRLEVRLRFLATVARLFHLGSRNLTAGPGKEADDAAREIIHGWLARVRRNRQDLLALMDAVHKLPVPAPSGSYDSLVEYDRRNVIKQRLLTVVIGNCLETTLAAGSLQGMAQRAGDAEVQGEGPPWEPALLRLEQALWLGDTAAARAELPRFLEQFQHEPLLFTPLNQGGHPRLILRASIAQTLLRALVANLPRLGLLRETYALLRVAQTMEREQKLHGPRATEFDRLHQLASQASLEAVVETFKAAANPPSDNDQLCLLDTMMRPYHAMWGQHSGGLRLSILETVADDKDWAPVRDFIRKYGNELFHVRFMTLGNLRGILQRGVGAYLKYLQENPDAQQQPLRLINDIERGNIAPADAERCLQTVLLAIIENYEEYKDYNTTTPHSDYGENLHTLLDFLRLKAGYERHAWQIRPFMLIHEVLVKHRSTAAQLWQEQVEMVTRPNADEFLNRLAALEKQHGMRLRTIADRVRERFVQPLVLDRLCALIEPAYDAARDGSGDGLLQQLEEGLRPCLATPVGAGFDVPPWLRRLEGELRRVQLRRTAIANLAENLLQVPRVVMPLEDVQRQLEDWPQP
jgi:hypothetical protein